MNYSKDSTSKKDESTNTNKNKTKKNVKKTKVVAFRIILVSIIIALFALLGAGIGVFMGIINSAPDISSLELKPTTDYTSFIYDQNGAEIDRISAGENRIYATLDQIPKYLQDAVVATEDERFWEHNGIDLKGILRALVKNLETRSFTEGASTITQQLIKNNILTTDKTFTRKIQEQYLALKFEQAYSETYGKVGAKEIILEYYLNTIALGNGNNGVQAAANFYFNKDVSELTLRESVVIAGITQYPGRYDPIRNPDENHSKSVVILDKMLEQGMITQSEYTASLEEDPYTDIASVHQTIDRSSQTYFVDAVIDQIISDLQSELGLTMVQANNMIYGGGISIFTTLDQEMQAIVDKHMADNSLFPSKIEYLVDYTASIEKADGTIVHRGAQGMIASEDGLQAFIDSRHEDWGVANGDRVFNTAHSITPQTQAAFVIMDHNNGHVKALSGGRGEKQASRTFNRATDAERQPGSTFKVLSSYAPGLDMGIMSPGTVFIDEKTTFNEGTAYAYTPNNWYSGYRGAVTAREGVFDSLNIVAVQALDQVGIQNAYDYLMNFGFTTLTDQDKVYALTLGGLTTGVTPLELNAAYATIANQGVHIEPLLYTQVKDREGNILLDNSTPETQQVIKSSTASMLTDMMEDTIDEGTGGRIATIFNDHAIAGKTGTTSDNKDFLFAGYTPYYTATVWMGYDNPKAFTSSNMHLNLWATIMDEIHDVKQLPYVDFEKDTTGYTRVSVCEASGKLVTDLCKQDTSHGIVTDYFLKDNLPDESCNVHVERKICTISNKIATEFCPTETVVNRVIIQTLNPDGTSEDNQLNAEDLCPIHTELIVPEEPEVDLWPFPDLFPFNPFGPEENSDDETPEIEQSLEDVIPSLDTEDLPESDLLGENDEILPPLPDILVEESTSDEESDFYIPQE